MNFFYSNLAHLIPLIIGVSIVYGATRDERPGQMVQKMIHSAVWMVGVLGVISVALLILGRFD